MELKLQALFSGQKDAETGELALDFTERDFGSFTVEGPVQLCYAAQAQNGAASLDITLEAKLQAACARCLASFTQPWSLSRSFRILPHELDEEFPELPFTAAGGLDLDELAYGELLMDVDPVLLCREDCPGLCQQCGRAKNECACAPESGGDPRLQVLKQLLQAEEDTKP